MNGDMCNYVQIAQKLLCNSLGQMLRLYVIVTGLWCGMGVSVSGGLQPPPGREWFKEFVSRVASSGSWTHTGPGGMIAAIQLLGRMNDTLEEVRMDSMMIAE